MNTLYKVTLAALLLGPLALLPLASTALAQDTSHPYDRVQGELSIGTHAPGRAQMMSTLQTSQSSSEIFTILEYGERVECMECVPVVENLLLTAPDPRTREISAWWLRRRPFGFGAVMHHMTSVLASDSDPTQRARAAMAIGEFMDIHGVAPLASALVGDHDPAVRAAAVTALARINAPSGNDMISVAFNDADVNVRRTALTAVSRVNFFHAFDAVLGLLSDTDPQVRAHAARILGTYQRTEASSALIALLQTDAEGGVRTAAAWALGRIGGSDAHAALATAATTEHTTLVLDAIHIAAATH